MSSDRDPLARSYQTAQGIVSGIQWIPAEATSVLPANATPADSVRSRFFLSSVGIWGDALTAELHGLSPRGR